MIEKQTMLKKTFYIPEDLMDRLQDYSNKTGQPMSSIVRVSILDYLMDHPLNFKEK